MPAVLCGGLSGTSPNSQSEYHSDLQRRRFSGGQTLAGMLFRLEVFPSRNIIPTYNSADSLGDRRWPECLPCCVAGYPARAPIPSRNTIPTYNGADSLADRRWPECYSGLRAFPVGISFRPTTAQVLWRTDVGRNACRVVWRVIRHEPQFPSRNTIPTYKSQISSTPPVLRNHSHFLLCCSSQRNCHHSGNEVSLETSIGM